MTTNTEPTNAELLSRLNSLRADLGMTALAGWKESRAKLEAAIAKARDAAQVALDTKVADAEAAPEKTFEELAAEHMPEILKPDAEEPAGQHSQDVAAGLTDDHAGNLENHPIVKDMRANDAKKTKKSTKTAAPVKVSAPKKTEAKGDTVTLADIARDLKVNPKVARAKARRHSSKLETLRIAGTDGWVFPSKNRTAVVNILTGKK
jgi:hypothetical protein